MGNASAMIARHGTLVTVTRFLSAVQTLKIRFSADLVAGDVFTARINGEAISVPYNGTHGQTLIDIADAIEGCDGIASASVVTGTRDIEVESSWAGNAIVVTHYEVNGANATAEVSIIERAGGIVDGEYEAGTTEQFSVKMSVQPLSGKELLELPEMQRARNYMKAYCAVELFTVETSSSAKADRVTYRGKDFEVQSCQPWIGSLTHWKVRLAEVNAEVEDDA